jgi:uncharacterized protein (UPF0332 family)
LIEEEKRQLELALYRIQQAEESLDEARYLLAGNKSPRSVINRAYYSMFYSILALLIFEPYSSSKHSGVLSYFNRHFIKGGMIPKDIGRAVNKAFDIRQRGDYREQISLNPNQVEPFIDWAEKLIESVRDLLKSSGHI